jgi:hypothetical protein
VTPDWNPNSLDPQPSRPAAGGPTTIPPPSTPTPGIPVWTPASAQSRVGPILFTFGLGLIALDFLLESYVYYQLTSSPGSFNFQTYELIMALAQIFAAFGVIFASFGWVLDKRATQPTGGFAVQNEGKVRRLAGQILVLLGAWAFAGANLFYGVIELESYSNVSINLPIWTLSFIYAVQGVGVLVIAVGWWIQRSAKTFGRSLGI